MNRGDDFASGIFRRVTECLEHLHHLTKSLPSRFSLGRSGIGCAFLTVRAWPSASSRCPGTLNVRMSRVSLTRPLCLLGSLGKSRDIASVESCFLQVSHTHNGVLGKVMLKPTRRRRARGIWPPENHHKENIGCGSDEIYYTQANRVEKIYIGWRHLI